MGKSKKIRPLGDKILVERNEAQEMTEGGIIIPDASQEKPLEATVVAVGNGRVDKSGNVTPLVVKEGDIVGPDDIILILESEKASMEIPAEVSGENH